MELATCMLALGGDAGQTIQKYNVTPSEVAVLRLIHGNDSVTEIVKIGKVDRPMRVERARLVEAYGRGMDGVIRCPAVDSLFPGVAARLFERFSEIEGYEDDVEVDLSAEVVERFDAAPPAKKGRGKKAEKTPEPEVEETPETAFE